MDHLRNDEATTTLGGTLGAPAPETGWEQRGGAEAEGSLAAHLRRGDLGEEDRLSPERYADELAAVARSIAELHERGIVHGAIRSQGVSFDPDTGRLQLPPPALGGDGALPSVDDPYVAPEQHLGEEGPSIDQYALGVLAREVFTARAAPAPTAPLQDALRRATAPNPDDRFPDIARFGEELASAVRREAPHGLADRVAARSARSRAALAPGGLLAAIILITALGDARDPPPGRCSRPCSPRSSRSPRR